MKRCKRKKETSNKKLLSSLFDISTDSIASNITDISLENIFNTHFRRGINLGNIFETPEEGAWGLYFMPEYLPAIKQRRFVLEDFPWVGETS